MQKTTLSKAEVAYLITSLTSELGARYSVYNNLITQAEITEPE